ncbi:hypothetical protein ACFOFO_24390, partial [Undibacterium arcticum]
HVFTQGETSMKAEWDADKAVRVQADNAAILSRVKNNERVAEQQHLDNDNITKVHDEELSTVRTALAHSERLRIGTALCGGSAGVTQTAGAGSGDAADPGGRLVREDVGRDLDALKLKMEETAATGRACQSFARANGMAH